MKVFFAVYSIDASEDTFELKQQVAKLNGHVSFLQTEKGSLEREKNSIDEKLAMLQLHVQELENKANRVLELQDEVESLLLSLEKLRPLSLRTLCRPPEMRPLPRSSTSGASIGTLTALGWWPTYLPLKLGLRRMPSLSSQSPPPPPETQIESVREEDNDDGFSREADEELDDTTERDEA
ncbi:hypothetical protein ACLB2K_076472 [Fragaria x ananassa]